jgi:hypothetical protein
VGQGGTDESVPNPFTAHANLLASSFASFAPLREISFSARHSLNPVDRRPLEPLFSAFSASLREIFFLAERGKRGQAHFPQSNSTPWPSVANRTARGQFPERFVIDVLRA